MRLPAHSRGGGRHLGTVGLHTRGWYRGFSVLQVLGNIVERGALFSELDYMNVLQLLHRFAIIFSGF